MLVEGPPGPEGPTVSLLLFVCPHVMFMCYLVFAKQFELEMRLYFGKVSIMWS